LLEGKIPTNFAVAESWRGIVYPAERRFSAPCGEETYSIGNRVNSTGV
jgi:hypothetical protein